MFQLKLVQNQLTKNQTALLLSNSLDEELNHLTGSVCLFSFLKKRTPTKMCIYKFLLKSMSEHYTKIDIQASKIQFGEQCTKIEKRCRKWNEKASFIVWGEERRGEGRVVKSLLRSGPVCWVHSLSFSCLICLVPFLTCVQTTKKHYLLRPQQIKFLHLLNFLVCCVWKKNIKQFFKYSFCTLLLFFPLHIVLVSNCLKILYLISIERDASPRALKHF